MIPYSTVDGIIISHEPSSSSTLKCWYPCTKPQAITCHRTARIPDADHQEDLSCHKENSVNIG